MPFLVITHLGKVLHSIFASVGETFLLSHPSTVKYCVVDRPVMGRHQNTVVNFTVRQNHDDIVCFIGKTVVVVVILSRGCCRHCHDPFLVAITTPVVFIRGGSNELICGNDRFYRIVVFCVSNAFCFSYFF